MYLKNIILENIGPIDLIDYSFRFKEDQSPVPLILVGKNGSGKSTFVSHIVNALVSIKQQHYDDTEIEKEQVFKVRGSTFIKTTKNHSYSNIAFQNDIYVSEWQLRAPKKDFENRFKYIPNRPGWDTLQQTDLNSHFLNAPPDTDPAKSIIATQCCLYFPSNRFENPSWLNIDGIRNQPEYLSLKNIQKYSNRNIISTMPLKVNQNWLLEVFLDRQLHESVIYTLKDGTKNVIYSGQCSNIYITIVNALKIIFDIPENARIGIYCKTRHNRTFQILIDDMPLTDNLFSLSSGEALTLNILLSILRDYDIATSNIPEVSQINGIVIIDEIDLHLHIHFQQFVLPKLLKLFPKIQFIVTTHSPFFLKGMEEAYNSNAIDIINLPTGERVYAESFSEFVLAYDTIKSSQKFQREIEKILAGTTLPIVFVEGDYDIQYLETAARLLNKSSTLSKVSIKSADGCGNLDNIYKVTHIFQKSCLLLYDCDAKKENQNFNQQNKQGTLRKVIPYISTNSVSKGIENLFDDSSIDRVKFIHKKWFCTKKIIKEDGDDECIQHTTIEIKSEHKKKVCDWLCENGTAEDFRNFVAVFDIIEDWLREKQQ